MCSIPGEEATAASARLSNRLWPESFTSCFFGPVAGNTCYEFFLRGRVDRRHVIERFIDLKRGGGGGEEAVKV